MADWVIEGHQPCKNTVTLAPKGSLSGQVEEETKEERANLSSPG